MKKILMILSILLLTGCIKNEVTEKEFIKGLDKVINSKYNIEGYKYEYKDNEIIMSLDDKHYKMDVEFKDRLVITYNLEIKKGISYEEYNKAIESLSLPMFGYVAALDNYNVSLKNSSEYFGDTYLDGMLDNYKKSKYLVIYDKKEKDMFVDKYEFILINDFCERVIEYVKDNYSKNIEFSDPLNTYTFKQSSKCENDKCIITSKLILDYESDFKDINDYYKK